MPKPLLSLLTAFGLVSLALLFTAGSLAQTPGGGRPPMFTPGPIIGGPPTTPVPGLPTPPPGSVPSKAAPQFMPVSLFGMNLYLTGLERSTAESSTLGALAAAGGVKWSREELSWANIEPTTKGQFNWAPYDSRLAYDTSNNINVVGMLLTTPHWASSNPGAPDYFWYEPSNYNDYYDFVRAAVNRWKTQIHVWEIWNEPNHAATWNCLNNCNHAVDYAVLLQGAAAAVRSVDPSARVLIGGLYVHDTTNEGMAFLNQVVSASGGAVNFDGLSIHTYMPDRVPESMRSDSVVQNFQYRLNMANDWISAHGGQPAEIWVTEDGRSTCTGCAYPWSEEDQASMLARMYGIAAATPRVVQFDWFQFEDKFNTPSDLYGGMSIVRDNYTVKPGYNAYKTASQQLDGATFAGNGPQMIPGLNPNQPDNSDYIAFDYRFIRNGTPLHVVWRVNDSLAVNYPVETAQVDVIDRDGGVTRVVASGGTIPLTISPRPQYIVNVACTARFSDVCPDHWAYAYIEFMAQHGIVGGYPDGTFRPNNTATRAQLAKMVAIAMGWPLVTPTTPSFRDVPTSDSFYGYVETVKVHGVISGYPCGGVGEPCPGAYFRPNNSVTRAQSSKMIVIAFGWPINTTGGPHFSDVASNSTFYEYVETAFNHTIVTGYGSEFRPNNNVTRAQLSKMLYLSMNP